MKQNIVICTGLLAVGLACAQPAAAQGVYPAATALPPYEIVAIVRSTGLEPLSRPVRHGANYTLHAVDPAGQPVRVTVDARLGRIVAVAPAAHPRFAAPVLPPPYARPPGAIATVPDGYGPATRATVLRPGPESTNGIAARERLPLAPGRVASAGAATASDGHAAATPLPRPRPALAAAEQQPAPVSAQPAAPVTPRKDTVQAKNVPPPAPAVELHE